MRLETGIVMAGMAVGVLGHKGCGGHEFERQVNPGGRTITDVNSWSSRKRDGGNPCDGYSYAPSSSIASKYPGNWQTATIQPNDSAAQAKFQEIDAKVRAALRNTVPRGKPNGDWSGVTYNGGEDPDCWWTYTQCTSPKSNTGLQADVTTVPEPGSWGLTYDDGPNCGNAPLYGWMKDNNVRATLFYIGSNVFNWPLQAISGLNGSHEICVHTWSHQYMTALSNEQVFAELYYTQKAIKDIVGVTPLCWRPPYGDVDNRVRMFAEELNMRTIIWSEDTDDWAGNSGTPPAKIDANYQAIIEKQKNGQYSTFGPIVLTHEISDFTINEALKFLPTMKSTFAHLVPIASALNTTQPYAEQDIYYPTFAEYIAGKEDVTTTTGVSSAPSSSSTSSASSAVASSASGTNGSSSAQSSSASASGSGSSTDAGPTGNSHAAISGAAAVHSTISVAVLILILGMVTLLV